MLTRHLVRLVAGAIFYVGVAGVPPAAAIIRNVPASYATIQLAIDAASNGDEVVIASGTYHERINFSGQAITVRSANPNDPAVVAATIIDADDLGSVVTFTSGETAGSVLTGLTITDGSAFEGGGIYCRDSSPTISANVISGNAASEAGGGIYCQGASPIIAGNTISGNSASNYGGGILCAASSATISQNMIVSNSVTTYGGGISCLGASATVSDNTITSNSGLLGGGIYCSGSTATISRNTIATNTASYGGAAYCYYSSEAISNNRIVSNAANNGGGVFSNNSSTVISGNTIRGNSASANGGGIVGYGSGSWTIRNTIVAFSTAGGGIYVWAGAAAPTVRYCDVYSNTGGNYVGMTDRTGANGNISADPLFADAANGDLHLKSLVGRWLPAVRTWVTDSAHSPCIDTGDPASPFGNEPLPSGGRVNMGAYGNTTEASKGGNSPPTAPTTITLAPGSPTSVDDITATAMGGSDPDSDPLTIEYQWACLPEGQGWGFWTAGPRTLVAAETTRGEQWKARARLFDGTAYGPWLETSAVTIGDAPPLAPSQVAIDPQFPVATTTLTAEASGASDPDDDAITYEYEWASNSGGAWSAFGALGALVKDHEWKARARASAGGAASDWVESLPVKIENTPPTSPASVAIAPGSPRVGQNLTATAGGSTDADAADTVRYEVQWAKKPAGGAWGAWGNLGGTLSASLITKGEQWKARARATDIGLTLSAPGVAGGASIKTLHVSGWLESAAVTVADTPPTPPTLVQVRQPGSRSGDTLAGYATGAADADGETVEYLFQWSCSTDGGTVWDAWGRAGKVLAETTVKGNMWKNRARSRAAGVTSAWVESLPLTVRDSPPTAPTAVTVTPSSPNTNNDLRAAASGGADPDGDPTGYIYQWNRSVDGGLTWAGWIYNGRVLPNAFTAVGEKWKARARTLSGSPFLRSAWVESAAVTIGAGAGAPAVVAAVGPVPRTPGGLTQITVNLSAAAAVWVRILNLAGREVAVLPQQSLEAGTQTLLWSGESDGGTAVAPGRYLLSVEARQEGGGVSRTVVPFLR